METAKIETVDTECLGVDEVYNIIKDDLIEIENTFKENLSSRVYLIKKIGEYILLSGGKRLRPALLTLSSMLCDYKGRRHIALGSIIEFIHTATLLHDDVVDNAKMRRGQSSANSVWGNGASVLVGDFFFSKSFYLMVADSDLRILEIMSKTTTEMAEGEVLQLLKCSDINTTEEEYLTVVINKTASLLSAACRIGAILGRVSEEKERALADFGLNVGIAFQLMDDCLDYTSKNEELGKAIGNDLREGKVTLPLIHTFRECPDARGRDIIKTAIESDDLTDDHFSEVIKLIYEYGGIEYTKSVAKRHIEKAKSNLLYFGPSIFRSALFTIADYILERRF